MDATGLSRIGNTVLCLLPEIEIGALLKEDMQVAEQADVLSCLHGVLRRGWWPRRAADKGSFAKGLSGF